MVLTAGVHVRHSIDSATPYVEDGIASEADLRNGGQKPQAILRREIHAAHEVLEARVGAERIEHAPNF